MKHYSFLFKIIVLLVCGFQALADSNDLIQLTRNALSYISETKTEEIENLDITSCGTGCVSFGSLSSETEFKLQINSDISSPQVISDNTSRTLQLPFMDVLTLTPSKSMRSAFKNWLISHELHPYVGSFSKPKTAQRAALQASHIALEQGASSLLHIAPTGMGKTWVLVQTLLKQIREFSKDKNIFIVTAHQLQLIHQLSFQLKTEQEQQRDFHIIDWRNVLDKSWQSFASEIKQASERDKPTVLVMTSQSLKRRLPEFFTQTEKEYKYLQNSFLSQLGGLYIDEAHHLGAYQTKFALLKLLDESRRYQRNQGERRRTFLYGTTATPVHPEVDLREFFEREHWAYLNTEGNLFEKHNVESVLKQLAIGIDRGELTPFDDLYVIGENSFKDLAPEELKESSVFIQSDSSFHVLNPNHYEALLRIIGPVLLNNKKGFIVTATIAEAERLQEFLNRTTTGIEFEAYHSKMEDTERRDVLNRSKSSKGSHYIIAVRALDEGVDLPHLSAYIDLNLNVSINQMIHRIGRVLRLSPSKQNADILFLINYRNEQLAKDALSILEKLETLSFSRENKRYESGDSHLKFEDAGIRPLNRAELQEMRNRLPEYIRKFWAEKYTLEEIPGAVARLNANSPKEEQINSIKTYEEFRYKDKKLPSVNIINRQYKNKYGNSKGLSDFITTGKLPEPKTEFYSLEEIPPAVAKLNVNSPDAEQINSIKTYEEFRYKDKKLPPFSTINSQYKKKHGNLEGVVGFILTGKLPEPKTEFYSLEEIPPAVAKLNASSPTEEQIKSRSNYNKFRYKDKKLPQWNTAVGWFLKEHGYIRGFVDFMFNRTEPELHSLEEIPPAVAKLNANSPDAEQINSVKNYEQFRHKDSKLPSLSTAQHWFKKKYGSKQGFLAFITTGKLPEPKLEFYSIKEIPGAVARLNANSPKEEQIKSVKTYEKFRYKDPKLRSWNTAIYWFKKEYGSQQGFLAFITTGKLPEPKPEFYSLEEIPPAVAKLNANSPKEEQIKSVKTYEKFRYKDPKLRSLSVAKNLFTKEHGSQQGFLAFVTTGKLPELKPEFYSIKEIPGAVARLNANSPKEEQIKSVKTYEKFRYKDPKLRSWNTAIYWFKKEYGSQQGFLAFITTGKLPEPKPEFYSLEEIPPAVAKLNANSPKEEQIKSVKTYEEFRYKDPKLRSWSALRKSHGHKPGLLDLVLGRVQPEFYSLEEIPRAVARLNANSSKEEQINSVTTFNQFRYKDPKLRSWSFIGREYEEKYGNRQGLSDFMFGKSCEDTISRL